MNPEMMVYKDVKEIAKCIAKIENLTKKLANAGLDLDGIDWVTAEFVSLDNEDIRYFQDTNGVTEQYYVDQWQGYCEDDFYGNLYFKTDVPGQYVRVHFHM